LLVCLKIWVIKIPSFVHIIRVVSTHTTSSMLLVWEIAVALHRCQANVKLQTFQLPRMLLIAPNTVGHGAIYPQVKVREGPTCPVVQFIFWICLWTYGSMVLTDHPRDSSPSRWWHRHMFIKQNPSNLGWPIYNWLTYNNHSQQQVTRNTPTSLRFVKPYEWYLEHRSTHRNWWVNHSCTRL
jgi:hypothetical protein